jgi:hypothetical protein
LLPPGTEHTPFLPTLSNMNSFPENTLIRHSLNGKTRFARVETIDEEDNFRVFRSDNNDIFTTLHDFVGCHYTDTKTRMPRRLNEWAACEFQKSGKWWSCEEMLPPAKYRAAAAAASAAIEASDSDSDYSPEDDGESEHDSDFDDLVSEHDDNESVNEPDEDVLTDGDYESEEDILPRHIHTRRTRVQAQPIAIPAASSRSTLDKFNALVDKTWAEMKKRDPSASHKKALVDSLCAMKAPKSYAAKSVVWQKNPPTPAPASAPASAPTKLRRSARIAATAAATLKK